MEETKANAKKERERESRKRRTRKGEGDEVVAKGAEKGERGSERRSTAVGIFARERAREGKRGKIN